MAELLKLQPSETFHLTHRSGNLTAGQQLFGARPHNPALRARAATGPHTSSHVQGRITTPSSCRDGMGPGNAPFASRGQAMAPLPCHRTGSPPSPPQSPAHGVGEALFRAWSARLRLGCPLPCSGAGRWLLSQPRALEQQHHPAHSWTRHCTFGLLRKKHWLVGLNDSATTDSLRVQYYIRQGNGNFGIGFSISKITL